MRLLCVTSAAIFAGAATAAETPMVLKAPLGPPPAAHCPPTVAQQVAQRLDRKGHRPQLHLLNALPPASAYAAVLRRVDGCEAPLILRYDVQGSMGKAHE